MKRSLALAVCGFSLVLALVGGWLADRQFTAALDTLAYQAVLQHQRNLFGYADTLQEVKADDSPHMILADDSGTRYVNASDKAFAGQLYFDRQRLIVGAVPCTFALLDQTGRVIYSKLPDTIPESELAALKDADTTTMRLCGQTLLLCDQVAGASGQRVWVWMVTALDASSACSKNHRHTAPVVLAAGRTDAGGTVDGPPHHCPAAAERPPKPLCGRPDP